MYIYLKAYESKRIAQNSFYVTPQIIWNIISSSCTTC